MSLKSFHIFFITVCLGFFVFLLSWSGRRYVQQGSLEELPLAVVALGGLAIGLPYLNWFVGKSGLRSK